MNALHLDLRRIVALLLLAFFATAAAAQTSVTLQQGQSGYAGTTDARIGNGGTITSATLSL